MELQLYNAQRPVTAIYGNQAFTLYSIASGLSPGQGLAHIRMYHHNRCVFIGKPVYGAVRGLGVEIVTTVS